MTRLLPPTLGDRSPYIYTFDVQRIITTVFVLSFNNTMSSLPVIVSDGEDEVIATPRRTILKRKARDLFGSESEDEFVPRTQRNKSKIVTPKKKKAKIQIHKVEIIRPAVAEVARSAPPPPAARVDASTPPPQSSPPVVQYDDDDTDFTTVSTPERAVTPDIPYNIYAVEDRDQDAQPLVDPVEMELMGDQRAFHDMKCFNILCGAASVDSTFKLPDFKSFNDKNTRLLKSSHCPIDHFSRKFLSVGLFPHRGFTPSMCLSFDTTSCILGDFGRLVGHLRYVKPILVSTLGPADRKIMKCDSFQSTLAPGRRLRIAGKGANLAALLPGQYINLSEDEIDRIIESKQFIEHKLKSVRQWANSTSLAKKYLLLLQTTAVKAANTPLRDQPTLKEYLRRELLLIDTTEDDMVNECLWDMFTYYRGKTLHDIDYVVRYVRENDRLIVDIK